MSQAAMLGKGPYMARGGRYVYLAFLELILD